ncbi:MAG TPA: hypothetical protein VFA18_06750 [Gemmataceae bacterium]|nr:hypothetical protein [Gemmataceae bacterium]
MQLTQLQPVREDNKLIGWSARFTDDEGQVRLAHLGLGCLMSPSAFVEAVARQGVRFAPSCGQDLPAWRDFVQSVTS